jgi:hypothetical protein
MFYEERIMDGKLWCRSTPDGEWRSVSYEVLMGRMILAERNLDKAITVIEELKRR